MCTQGKEASSAPASQGVHTSKSKGVQLKAVLPVS